MRFGQTLSKRIAQISIALLFICSGCSRVTPLDETVVVDELAERLDQTVIWRQGNPQTSEITEFIDCALVTALTADMAVQVALLNNPKVQASFEQLGIAQADLVEAGLLSNPTFDLEIRYPHSKNLHTNIEYLILGSLLDFFLIPLRTSVEAVKLEQTKFKVANEILDLAFEVRETYFEFIATRRKLDYLRSVADLASIQADLATRQNDVGNINTLNFRMAQAQLIEANLELGQAQTNAIRVQEKFNRLLGFPTDLCLILPIDLPENEFEDFDLCQLENWALEQRLDLIVARFEISRICQMLGLKNWWVYTNLKRGLAGERDPDGTNSIGPGFSGEIPIFNYGQAARMRLYAELRRAKEHLAELEIIALSEVREAYKLFSNYVEIHYEYKNELLPMQAGISSASEELYNVMGLGVDKLLDNKRREILLQANYLDNLKNVVVSKTALERSLGGYLLYMDECHE